MPVSSVCAPAADDRRSEPTFSLFFQSRQPWVRYVLAFCLFETAFYFAYRYGMAFSHATPSPFWFPDSVLLCALLLVPPRWWWLVLLAPLPIRLSVEVPPDAPQWFLLATFAIDSAKGLFAAATLRRFMRNALRFETVTDFGVYCLFAVLLAPALAAFAGAAVRQAVGPDYWPTWEQWFWGNALASLIITPAIFYWFVGARWKFPRRLNARWLEGALLTAGLVLTAYLAFESDTGGPAFAESRFYAPVPFLFWAAVRFGMRGASAAIAILACFAVAAALQDMGPFAGLSPAEKGIALQRFLLLRAAPLYLIAVLIEQKARVEQSLGESERRYREVVESQTGFVCRFLPDTTLTFVNEAYCRSIGRDREQLMNTRLLDLLPEETRTTARQQMERAASSGEPCEWEHEVKFSDGGGCWQHWAVHAIYNAAGQLREFQAIGQDITDRKRADEANRNLARAARLAVAGELTAMVAHEVNQPLSAILSNAEAAEILLQSPEPPLEQIREILEEICQEDLRASEVTRRMRTLLRNREIQLQPLNLNETALGVLRLVASDARQRRVQLRSELAEELPLVSADRMYLEQVLINLIVNGMDAMQEAPDGARELTLKTAHNGDGTIEVRVTDRGRGIPADAIKRIFESFFTTKPDGMGLGLSIARSIIEAHRGRIWAENNPSGGATFRFTVRAVGAPRP